MSPDDAKAYIVSGVKVTRQNVAIAMAYVLKHFDSDAEKLIAAFLKSVDAEMPQQVTLHSTVNPTPTLDAAISAISWRLAVCEGIWNLIASAALFPASDVFAGEVPSLEWTTVVQGSGTSSGFTLSELSIRVPGRLVKTRSMDLEREQPLTNPDLYLREIDLADLNPEIEESLREGVKAFRHGLYLACLAMLGRVVEIAWIELGLSLAKTGQGGAGFNADKLMREIEGTHVGLGRKIGLVTEAYSKKEIFGALAKKANVRVQDLKNCVVWADCVRESRNSLHYGAQPSMSNTYEKVAALLIGAVPHLQTVVHLTQCAKAAKNG